MDITSYLLGKKAGEGGGITPTGTLPITENGEYDVTNYASADVEVPSANLSDYFGTAISPIYSPGGYIKKIPYDIDVTGVTDLTNYFHYWQNLKSVTLKNGSSVTRVKSMFEGCVSLMFIDIRDITISTMSYANYQSFLGSNTFGRVPYNCLIVVKDSTEKTWLNTNFSSYTNVMTVEEYEAS